MKKGLILLISSMICSTESGAVVSSWMSLVGEMRL